MVRSLLRLMLMGTMIAVLFIGGLRLLPATPPDTSAVAALFPITNTCPTGCMLGIRPETTRLRDGVERLQAHEWVGGVFGSWENDLFNSEVTVRWRWSGTQPDFIDSSVPGIMMAESFGYDGVPDHIVTSMTIATNFRLYDLYQMMGPTSGGVARYDSSRHALLYGVSYHDPEAFTRTSLMAFLPCPASLMTYWHATATLEYRGGVMLTPYVPPEQMSGLCLGA